MHRRAELYTRIFSWACLDASGPKERRKDPLIRPETLPYMDRELVRGSGEVQVHSAGFVSIANSQAGWPLHLICAAEPCTAAGINKTCMDLPYYIDLDHTEAQNTNTHLAPYSVTNFVIKYHVRPQGQNVYNASHDYIKLTSVGFEGIR